MLALRNTFKVLTTFDLICTTFSVFDPISIFRFNFETFDQCRREAVTGHSSKCFDCCINQQDDEICNKNYLEQYQAAAIAASGDGSLDDDQLQVWKEDKISRD